MNTTGPLAKFFIIIVIVAVFCVVMGETDEDAPQLVGWTGLQTVIEQPLSGLTAFQGDWTGWQACTGDPLSQLACYLGNIARLFVGVLWNLGLLIVWVLQVLFTVIFNLLLIGALQFSPPLPWFANMMVMIIVAPFWLLVIMTVLSMLRGN